MTFDKFLYPNHPARLIISGPSECGKSVFLTKLVLYINSEYNKKIHLLTQSSSRFISEFN